MARRKRKRLEIPRVTAAVQRSVAAGLDQFDATVFADSDGDIGVLRKLVIDGCGPELIAEIVL